jgi:IS30 family transposase
MRDQWGNVLKVSDSTELVEVLPATIYSLHNRGWSRRRIARELGINRETVGRYLRLAKPAISTAGTEGTGEAKPSHSTAGKGIGRKSQCEPLAEVIMAKVEFGLSAQQDTRLLDLETRFILRRGEASAAGFFGLCSASHPTGEAIKQTGLFDWFD